MIGITVEVYPVTGKIIGIPKKVLNTGISIGVPANSVNNGSPALID